MALSPQNVQAPFGAEVIRVNPSSVRFNLERTMTKIVPVVPTIVGTAGRGVTKSAKCWSTQRLLKWKVRKAVSMR